jgi:hypothetical protein
MIYGVFLTMFSWLSGLRINCPLNALVLSCPKLLLSNETDWMPKLELILLFVILGEIRVFKLLGFAWILLCIETLSLYLPLCPKI